MQSLPPFFLERLQKIIPPNHFARCLKSFEEQLRVSVRINTLKIKRQDALRILKSKSVSIKEVDWCGEALLINGATRRELGEEDLVKNGCLYMQSLSSMLPSLILEPKPGERVLDMCAAPGSKTTQIAAIMRNQGEIVAIERVKDRFYKLKSVVKHLGADTITFHLMDARKYQAKDQLFDRILVDAPCSSEGRFKISNKKTYFYWSLRKIKEMAHKQKGLLLAASRLLKIGGVLVYSTCSFAPEENEAVVDWLLRKTKGTIRVENIDFPEIERYDSLSEWNGKAFDKTISHCLRVLPDEQMEGFFVAKLAKPA